MPITIIIDTDGSTEISVNGIPGKKCKTITEQLERALGIVTSDIPTKEIQVQQKVTVKQ